MVFTQKDFENCNTVTMPVPAPRLSSVHSTIVDELPNKQLPNCAQHTLSILREFGFSDAEIQSLNSVNAIELAEPLTSKL